MSHVVSHALPLVPNMRTPSIFRDGIMDDAYLVYHSGSVSDRNCGIITFERCAAARFRVLARDSQDDYLHEVKEGTICEIQNSALLRDWSPGHMVNVGVGEFGCPWEAMKHYAIRFGLSCVWDIIATGYQAEIFHGLERDAVLACVQWSAAKEADEEEFWEKMRGEGFV